MDAANISLACGLVSRSYIDQGAAAMGARRRLIKALLSNRRLPAEGWDEATIEMLLQVGWCAECWYWRSGLPHPVSVLSRGLAGRIT
jgi:hypothetical protein